MAEVQRFEVAPNVGNHYAWLRTRLAVERTFMAWVRTAISLIAFGFTITEFFEHLEGTGKTSLAMRPEAPRELGLALIAAGVVALAISSWQYIAILRYLHSEQFNAIANVAERSHRTPLFLASLVLAAIGIFAFVAVFNS